MLLNPQATIVNMLEAIRSESDPQKRITLLRQYFHNYPQHQENPIEVAQFLSSEIRSNEKKNPYTTLAREFRVYLVREGLIYLPSIPDYEVLEDLLAFHGKDLAYVLSIMARFIRPYPSKVSKKFNTFLTQVQSKDPQGALGLVAESLLAEIKAAVEVEGESVDEARYKELMEIEAVETMSHYFSLTRDEKLGWLANWEEHLVSNLSREDKILPPNWMYDLVDHEKDEFILSKLVKLSPILGFRSGQKDASHVFPNLRLGLSHPDSRVRANSIEGLEAYLYEERRYLIFLLLTRVGDESSRVRSTALRVIKKLTEGKMQEFFPMVLKQIRTCRSKEDLKSYVWLVREFGEMQYFREAILARMSQMEKGIE